MALLNKNYVRQYAIIDTETTGLDPTICELLEVAVIKVISDKVVLKFHSLIRPSNSIPVKATAINGITSSDVKDAPVAEQVLVQVRNIIGDSILVGQNIKFDLSFVNKYTDKFIGAKCLDIKEIAKSLLGDSIGSFSQSELEKYFDVKIDNRKAHSALSDAEALHKVFLKILELVGEEDLEKFMFRNNEKISNS